MSLDVLDHAPTRAAALSRLAAFLPKAGRDYAETRNFDYGRDRRGNVSGLSPWIRHRVLTEAEILAAVMDRHGVKAADKFIQEVLWRGYFKGWLEHRPAVWHGYREGVTRALDQLDRHGGLRREYEAAIGGRTGIACFDAWREELVETGWLHNHARMWFASIWIFTLRLPWELGADFFLRHLLDGDPASNTLSWRWVAGLHTQGKTYQATAENIARFTNGRFRPDGQLADTAEPLTEAGGHDPVLPQLAAPLRPNGDYALVLTEDDLDLAAWSDGPPAAILVLPATRQRSPLAVSQIVTSFDDGLRADVAARAQSEWDCPIWCADDATRADDIRGWLAEHRLDQVVMFAAPTGPARDRWQPALDRLVEPGIAMVSGYRNLDIALWPHAAKGFFKVKKAAPDILEAAGLAPQASPHAPPV